MSLRASLKRRSTRKRASSHPKKKHRRKKRHTAATHKPAPVKHATTPPKVPPPSPPRTPPADPQSDGPLPVYSGDLGHPELKRLLWRAGFGPRRGDVDAMSSLTLQDAVHSLTRPAGAANLDRARAVHRRRHRSRPTTSWGHDHLWWLDRMVRSDQQLVERMTLVWHDWFATSNDAVGNQRLMLDQNATLRADALGSFRDLLLAVTQDPAMLLWLNGVDNRRGAPNENYARELMELFTLGADRGAYSETDVRQLALALTGWRADWVDGTGWTNFRYDATRHDTSDQDRVRPVAATSAGRTPSTSCCRTATTRRSSSPSCGATSSRPHPTPRRRRRSSSSTRAPATRSARFSRRSSCIRTSTAGRAMVKPPTVYIAGLLRALGRFVDTADWVWLGREAGQQLFYPPNVSGWDDSAWLDTSSWRGRWYLAMYALWDRYIDPWNNSHYDIHETPDAALAEALGFLGNPVVTADSQAALLAFSSSCLPQPMQSWQLSPYRAMRQNALRQLLATAPDLQTC